MKHTYTSKYKIIETFKVTDQQEIYIGMELLEDGVPVVINHVKNPKFVDVLKREPLTDVLNNLLYTEILEDEVVLITKVIEAEPLLVYLEDHYVPIEGRMNLVLSYFQEIVKYHHLEAISQNILIDEAQLVVQDGQVIFDELYLINDALEDVDFNYLCHKISSVLEKIIYFEYKNLKKEEVLLTEVHQFIFDLKNNNHFQNFHQILEEFRKLYIYHLCVESIVDPEENKTFDIKKYIPQRFTSSPQEVSLENKRTTKSKKNSKVIPIVTALTLLVAVGSYALLSDVSLDTFLNRNTKKNQQQISLPIAYFTIENEEENWHFNNESEVVGEDNSLEEYYWEIAKEDKVITNTDSEDLTLSFNEEGEYTVSLKVRDRFNQWSEKYSKVVTVHFPKENDEIGEDVGIEAEKNYDVNLGDGTSKDTAVIRGKEASLKIEAGQEKSPSVAINLNDNTVYDTLSFWVKSDSVDTIDVNIKGYNHGNLKYQTETSHSIKIPDRWELLSIQLSNGELQEILLEFTSFHNPFWVADIEFGTYK